MSILYGVKSRDTLDTGRAAIGPSTPWELTSASFDNTRKNHLHASEDFVMAEAERMQAEQYRKRTGRDVNELMPPQVYQQWREKNYDGRGDWTPAERRAVLEKKIAESGVEVDTLQWLSTQVLAQSDHRLQDVLSRRLEGSGQMGPMFAGGAAAAMTDPLNMMAMFYGWGAAKTLVKTILLDVALNAGIEVIQQPQIYKWQKELGKEYGLSEMATSVLFAGVGAGVLTSLVRGPTAAWRQLKGESEGILKEAMTVQDSEVLLLEFKPEGLTPAEHAANQAAFLARARGEVTETIKRGDVSLDLSQKLDPLAIAIRAASDGAPTQAATKQVDEAVKKALRERAEESALNLKDKELSPANRTVQEKVVRDEEKLRQNNQDWWEAKARESLDAKAKRAGRTIDTKTRKMQLRVKQSAEELRQAQLAERANLKKIKRRKSTTAKQKKQIDRKIARINELDKQGVEGWSRIALRAMEEQARRGGRPADYFAELLDEYKMPTKKLVPRVVAAEADRLRAASVARQQAAQAALDNHNVAVRARQEAAALKRGEIPERLRPTYEAGKAELEFQVRQREKYGEEALARLAQKHVRDLARLSMFPKAPQRTPDQVRADVELRESAEYKGALDAEMSRVKESRGEEMIQDENGNMVSFRQYLDDADKAEASELEAVSTCVKGGLG